MNKKTIIRFVGIILAVLSLVICCNVPIEGMPQQAERTLGVLLAALFMLICESFSVCVSCLMTSALLFITGCTGTISEAFSGYSNHILYFTTASFGISLAFRKSSLSRRLLGMIIRSDKLKTGQVMVIFMACAALLSALMSNVAAMVIFIPFAEDYLDIFPDGEKKVRTRKSMFICLAVSVLIGGMATPAGSSMNLICIDMLEKYTGSGIRFIDWMAVGIPLAIFMLAAAYFVITRIFPPCQPDGESMKKYVTSLHEKKSLSPRDIYITCVIGGVVISWIASSWIPSINITAAAITGLALFFLPKADIMTWEEFSNSISWPTFFIAGTLISVADSVIKTGLSDYFAQLLFPNEAQLSVFAAAMLTAAVTFVFMAVLPSAPAVITILSPIIIAFAQRTGVSPVILLLTAALCVSNIYLLPLDAPLAAAYDRKAFGMFDLPKATIWLQLIMIAVSAAWVPFICRMLGM
ncbi:MAG: SLC13 family permease [Oscillospiraceae bacterium]